MKASVALKVEYCAVADRERLEVDAGSVPAGRRNRLAAIRGDGDGRRRSLQAADEEADCSGEHDPAAGWATHRILAVGPALPYAREINLR